MRVFATALCLFQLGVVGASKPDILVVIADDVGFNGVGYSANYTGSSSGFLTPRIDALAGESVRLSSFLRSVGAEMPT